MHASFGWLAWLIWPMLFFGFWSHGSNKAMRKMRRQWDRNDGMTEEEETRLRQELEDQRAHSESLEVRVAELENRLDFTERLLTSRGEASVREG